ncbi:MAG: LysE family translocator [Thermoleophilia bacterium]
MSAHQIIGFALAALVIIVVPGPSVLFAVSRGVALGRRAALATTAGNTAGALLLAWLVSAGLGGIIATSLTAFTVVKLAGAAYLVFLGVQMWRHRGDLPAALAAGEVRRIPTRRIVRDGFVVGVTNPKVVVFFGAVLPQFVDRDGAPVWLQMGILSLVFAAIAMVSDGAWGVAAGTAQRWFARRPERLVHVGGAGAFAVMALGVKLALTGRND